MTNPFASKKEVFAPLINAERWLMGAFAVAGIGFTFTPVICPQQRPEVKLIQSVFGLFSSGCFTLSAMERKGKEKDYQAISYAHHEIVKEGLKGDFAFEQSRQQIESKRRLATYVNGLPLEERHQWAVQYGLHGLIELPQVQHAVVEQPRQLPGRIPSPGVAEFNQDAVQEIINPGVMSVLQELAAQHPEYIRIDEQWVDELCDSSSLQDMGNRANHHFGLWGETQSGKSTLAGVIINKIAAQSQGAAYVIGSDPKVFVTRWLCKFSQKFDGWKTLSDWVTFATKVIDQRQQEFQHNRKGTGLPEIFLVQDEVNVVYGGGEGVEGIVPKKVALNLCGMWNYIINFTAAMKIHGIFMGQNPLSGYTGFSRPAYKNICFIALGKVSSYILGKPADFLNVKAEVIDLLKKVCELLDKGGVRYALVIPTRGNPYVALIPTFDIDSLEQTTQSQADDEQETKDATNWYEILVEWVTRLERQPTPQELKAAWKQLTGQELNDNGVVLLMEKLGFKK